MKLSQRQIGELSNLLSENLLEVMKGSQEVVAEDSENVDTGADEIVTAVKENATLNEIIRSEVNATLDKLTLKVVPTMLSKIARQHGTSVAPEDVSNAVSDYSDRFMELSDDISDSIVELMKEYVDQVVRFTLQTLNSSEA